MENSFFWCHEQVNSYINTCFRLEAEQAEAEALAKAKAETEALAKAKAEADAAEAEAAALAAAEEKARFVHLRFILYRNNQGRWNKL